MQLLTSAPIVEAIHVSTRQRVVELTIQGIEPHLGVIMVGDRLDSAKYVAMKQKRAKELGIVLSLYHLDVQSSLLTIEESLQFLNRDEEVHGIIVQLPLPKSLVSDTDVLVRQIAPPKDVDCLSGAWEAQAASSALSVVELLKQEMLIPPMVASVLSIFDYYQVDLEGKKIVLVGHGRLVGKPLATFFKAKGYDVQVVDEDTVNIIAITQSADILISATGQNDLITYQWVKEGALVVDCAKDVHFDSVSQVASAITPAIGGVGPLTVAWLLHNVATAASLLNLKS